MSTLARAWRQPLPWALSGLVALAAGLPWAKPLFAAIFPALDRPMYEQDSFAALLQSHLEIGRAHV